MTTTTTRTATTTRTPRRAPRPRRPGRPRPRGDHQEATKKPPGAPGTELHGRNTSPKYWRDSKAWRKLPSPESGISELDQTAFPLKRAEFKHESPRMPAKMLPSSTGKIQRLQGQKVGRVFELALPTGTRACITLIGNGNDTTPGCSTHSLI